MATSINPLAFSLIFSYFPPLTLGYLHIPAYFAAIQLALDEWLVPIIYLQLFRRMQGLKRKRRCEDECKDHLYVLQCLRPNSAKYDIKLLFCPKYQRDPIPPEFIHPEFNDDRKYYTSAFILGVDRRVLVKNQQQEIMDHQKQVRDSLQKHNQLVFPRPNSKHSHCSVCKDHYRNYYAHIATEEHRLRIAASPYNNHIKTLCSMYEYLWEGAEDRADQEAERRMAEDEERRQQRMTEMTVRQAADEEDGEGEEEESLLDVQRGDQDEAEDEGEEEEGEEYRAKEHKKPRSSHHYNNDDTVPLARACKRAAPATGRIYQSEYLRKKQLLNSMITAERLQKEREERRYERERDKVKTDRDQQGFVREFLRVVEREGDVFVVMKATYVPAPTPTLMPPTANPSAANPTAPPVTPNPNTTITRNPTPNNNNSNNQTAVKESQIQTQPEFVWKRSEKPLVRREERQRERSKERQREDNQDRPAWPMPQRERERSIMASMFGGLRGQGIEKENRKYEIHYDEFDLNKQDANEEPYDHRHPYYSYPPPPPPSLYLPNSSYKDALKPDSASKLETPFGKQDHLPFKHESYKQDTRHGFEVREGKGYEPYNSNNHPHQNPYCPPYPYPPYEQDYINKTKEKSKEKSYEYPENPYNWPYPPYYPPPHEQHPPKPTATTTTTTAYTGNTNISINFPMYMCPPPPHHAYTGPSSTYSPHYMGYQYPPYPSQREAGSSYPPPPAHGYSMHQFETSHSYQGQGAGLPPSQSSYSNPYMHHYPPPAHYQYPQYSPPPLPPKKQSKF